MKEITFSNANVLIVGDVMLDKYYYGGVSRISPEAPVPVVNVNRETSTLGGASNVANNVASLYGKCKILGCAADDDNGKHVKSMLDNIGVSYEFLDIGVPTTSKLRVIGSKQQIVRLDFEQVKELKDSFADKFKQMVVDNICEHDVIVISDYGKGVCTADVCESVIQESNKLKKCTIVDPKGSDWSKYKDATIITPNVKELSEAYGKNVENTDEDVVRVAREIRKYYNFKYLIVTRSEKGMTIVSENSHITLSAEARDVFDVSGAGDTVVATMALSLASGYELEHSVTIANTAASIVVGKIGTAPITFAELSKKLNDYTSSKVTNFVDIEHVANREKANGKKVVFTNGCFDILHTGHTTYLKQAKNLGDILIVGVNSDSSVKRLKGADRPINNENDRANILEALEVIDYVVIFDEDTPHELIKLIKPNILAKGGDYKAEDVVGREFANETVIIDFVTGYSTTNTINKLKQ